MKNRVKISRKNRLKTALSAAVCLLLFTACQQEAFEEDFGENTQSLQLCFSVEDAFETDTQYVPMKNASRAGTDMVRIHNNYRYIILEEISGGDYLIVDTQTAVFDGDKNDNNNFNRLIEITPSQTYSNIVTSLRPGTYKIVIITTPGFLDFNPALIVGGIIPGPAKPQNEKYAVKYKKIFGSFYFLPFDVFYVQEDFTIKKTTDLHTSNTNKVNVKLTRRTSKFRVAVQETTTQDHTNNSIPYFWDVFGGPMGDFLRGSIDNILEYQNPSDGTFPWGLDVWGNLWYDPTPSASVNNGHKYLTCYTYLNKVLRSTTYAPCVPYKYFLPTHEDSPRGVNYFFSQQGKSFKVKNQGIEIVFRQQPGHPDAYYPGTRNFTLEHNKITGIVLKLNGNRMPNIHDPLYDDYYELEAVEESAGKLLDPAKLFHGNYEHDW